MRLELDIIRRLVKRPFLYRGIKEQFDYKRIVPVFPRKSTDTDPLLSKWIDSVYKSMGVVARSRSVFVSSDKKFVSDYGVPYVFVPCSSYILYSNPVINDLFTHLNSWDVVELYDRLDDSLRKLVKMMPTAAIVWSKSKVLQYLKGKASPEFYDVFLEEYLAQCKERALADLHRTREVDWGTAVSWGNEVMVKCSSYYLIKEELI